MSLIYIYIKVCNYNIYKIYELIVYSIYILLGQFILLDVHKNFHMLKLSPYLLNTVAMYECTSIDASENSIIDDTKSYGYNLSLSVWFSSHSKIIGNTI